MTPSRFAWFAPILALAIAAQAGELKSPYASSLATTVRSADSVVIEYDAEGQRSEVTFADPVWVEKLAAVLESCEYRLQSHCFCVSYPEIRLMRGSQKLGTFSIHHGEKLRAYTGTISGDFLVGADVGAAVIALAMEKKR